MKRGGNSKQVKQSQDRDQFLPSFVGLVQKPQAAFSEVDQEVDQLHGDLSSLQNRRVAELAALKSQLMQRLSHQQAAIEEAVTVVKFLSQSLKKAIFTNEELRTSSSNTQISIDKLTGEVKGLMGNLSLAQEFNEETLKATRNLLHGSRSRKKLDILGALSKAEKDAKRIKAQERRMDDLFAPAYDDEDEYLTRQVAAEDEVIEGASGVVADASGGTALLQLSGQVAGKGAGHVTSEADDAEPLEPRQVEEDLSVSVRELSQIEEDVKESRPVELDLQRLRHGLEDMSGRYDYSEEQLQNQFDATYQVGEKRLASLSEQKEILQRKVDAQEMLRPKLQDALDTLRATHKYLLRRLASVRVFASKLGLGGGDQVE